MYRCYQQEVNMGDNKKPILSVLVDEEKKRLFADLARAHNYSMGWLLNQAIDKMLEAGTIYVYRDSITPIDGAIPKPLPSSDIEEVVRRYVDKANESIIDDLLNLQAQVSELTTNRDNWDDLRADVADLREQLAKLTTIPMAKKPTIKTALTTTEPSKDIQAKINLLEDDPKLFARVKTGIEKGLSNADLGQWLDDGGFRNTKDETYKIDSVSRFRRAFEYLTSSEMEVRPNG
jgi:hypothetical protein